MWFKCVKLQGLASAFSLPGADSVRPGLGDLHVLSSFRRYGWLQPLQAAARRSEEKVAGCGGGISGSGEAFFFGFREGFHSFHV